MKRGRIHSVFEAARKEFGRQGGRATGPSKARGDSEHYRKLAAKSLAKRMANKAAREESGED